MRLVLCAGTTKKGRRGGGGWVSRRVDSSNSKKELGCRDPRVGEGVGERGRSYAERRISVRERVRGRGGAGREQHWRRLENGLV